MKFMGLILMCAASSMALLLPAMGVVKFPVLDQAAAESLATQPTTGLSSANLPPLSSDPQASAGMLVAAQVSGQDNASSTGGALGNSDPNARGTTNLDPNYALGKIPFTQIGSQKVGISVWLLLLPTLLVGLTMWTFGSSPKSSK